MAVNNNNILIKNNKDLKKNISRATIPSYIVSSSSLFYYATGFPVISNASSEKDLTMNGTDDKKAKETVYTSIKKAFEHSISTNSATTAATGAAAIDIQPIIVLDSVSGIIEVLFIDKKQPHTDEQWQAMTNINSILHVQNSFIIDEYDNSSDEYDADEYLHDGGKQNNKNHKKIKKESIVRNTKYYFMGVACVNRLIDRTILNKQRLAWGRGDSYDFCNGDSAQFELEDDNLLDAFRVVSGGCMHYKDPRPWCMTRRALAGMRRDIRKLQSDLKNKQCEIDIAGKNIMHIHNIISDIHSLLQLLSSSTPSSIHNDDDDIFQKYTKLIEQHEFEVQQLEDFRLELIVQEESMKRQLNQFLSVMLRQCELHTARRACCDLERNDIIRERKRKLHDNSHNNKEEVIAA